MTGDRRDYERGLPDYHDPTAGFAGAPAARSALTLRIFLNAFGVLFFGSAAVLAAIGDATLVAVLFGLLALVALGTLGWVVYRKRRGEPG